MPRVPARRLPGCRAALTAALLASLTAALPASAARADAAQPATWTATTHGPGTDVPVVLITGDRLLAGPANAVTVLPAPAAAAGGPPEVLISILCSRLAASRSVRVPAAALPYLGRGLDPSLFSISALEHAERGGRLPVGITYRGRLPMLPGVTITRRGHGTAGGYLTRASARLFGAALDRQFVADHVRDSYGTDGLFANGLSIALAGTRPARALPARPAYPMHTLTVRGTNSAGRPDTGDSVFVFNVDNCDKQDPFSPLNTFTNGTVKFSVPAGHYWAIGQFLGSSTYRLAVLPQFTVRGNTTTVAVSARSATDRISFTTPRPAALVGTTFTLLRADHGYTTGVNWIPFTSGSPLRVSPVRRRPTAGTLQAYTSGQLNSLGGRGTPYNYALNFPAPPGIIPSSLHYTARPADLAIVRDRYYQDVPSTGETGYLGGTPTEVSSAGAVGFSQNLHMPGRQIQYLSASPAMIWAGDYSGGLFAGTGGQVSAWRLFHAGQQVTADWGRYPLHPTPAMILPGTQAADFPALPTAVRAANQLTIDIPPFGDNQPGNTGSGLGPQSCEGIHCTGRYALYQNGTKITAGNAVKASLPKGVFVQAKLSPRPARLTFVLTASRASRQFKLSATSRDVWTWPTRPDPAATLPSPWVCGATIGRYGQFIYHHRCAVQPMLMLRYQIARISLSGSARPGRQAITINVNHLQLAAAARIASTSVGVSFNGGKTWHTARVTRVSGARFRAVFTAPANTPITLRTHATDTVGGQLTETITDAYRTAS